MKAAVPATRFVVSILVCLLFAVSAMADCLYCNQGDCFLTIYNGSAECYPVGSPGSGAGCLTKGSCIGAGKRPGGILYNTCKRPLAASWTLAAVTTSAKPAQPATAAAVQTAAKPDTRS